MSTKEIASALFSRTRMLILQKLVEADEKAIHLRELARLTGLDPTGVKRELANLVSAGIIIENVAGKQKEYSLNKGCPVYPELRMLVNKTVGLANHLRKALEPCIQKIDFAYVYGSFADGTAKSESDVDLMVVGSTGLRALAGILAKLSRKLSRDINPSTYTLDEYKKQLAMEGSFVNRIHNGPKIVLIGEIHEP